MSQKIDIYDFAKQTTGTTYPYVVVVEPNNTTPLIVGLLKEGDVPLVVEVNGKSKVVARMSNSAYNISRLLRTAGMLKYVTSENDSALITDIEDYLEVFKWT